MTATRGPGTFKTTASTVQRLLKLSPAKGGQIISEVLGRPHCVTLLVFEEKGCCHTDLVSPLPVTALLLMLFRRLTVRHTLIQRKAASKQERTLTQLTYSDGEKTLFVIGPSMRPIFLMTATCKSGRIETHWP